MIIKQTVMPRNTSRAGTVAEDSLEVIMIRNIRILRTKLKRQEPNKSEIKNFKGGVIVIFIFYLLRGTFWFLEIVHNLYRNFLS